MKPNYGTILRTCAGVVGFLIAQAVTATTVNFDTTPSATPIAAGTNIDSAYSSVGVTFGCFNNGATTNVCSNGPYTSTGTVPGGDAYAASSTLAHSGSNVFSIGNPGAGLNVSLINDQFGIGMAVFSTAQDTVSIWANTFEIAEGLGLSGDYSYLQAFNSAGTQVGFTSLVATGSTLGNWSQLTLTTASDNIAYIAFGTSYGNGPTALGTMFDDLCFGTSSTTCTGGGNNGGGPSVPEPAMLSLVGLCLAAVGFVRRRVSE